MTSEAYIHAIAVHLPKSSVTNEQLHLENPDWEMDRIAQKTGIEARHIASPGETASDLAWAAAERLFEDNSADRSEIDYVLFCTQSPDYFLPATACILQHRLRLPVTCGAIDFNQGCSGYVYGLQLASALVRSGTARKVLLLTGETYSRYIHPRDRSVRVLFGDAGSATLISNMPGGARIIDSVVGTDGGGWQNLIVPAGGARMPKDADAQVESEDENGSIRSQANLYMQGQELFAFTLKRVPPMVKQLLAKTGISDTDVDMFVFHQANAFMNEHLRAKMGIDAAKTPLYLREIGNTVSNTIPLTLCSLESKLESGKKVMLAGFGVGYSWGASLLEWGAVKLMPSQSMDQVPNDAAQVLEGSSE